MSKKNSSSLLQELLDRYTEKLYPSREKLVDALSSRKLTIYHGVDPTSPELHFGHATNYLLLKGLQSLGHQVILLIGDFTARIGDPTGKSQTRKSLTGNEVLENSKTYREQAGKILDFSSKNNPVLTRFNSTWLQKLMFEDVLRLAAHATVQQMIRRDMFQERIKAGREIYVHEFLYPLMQGYDSVAMNVDGEVGGSDQTFNMLVGRDLVKAFLKKEKFVLTTPLLINPKTGKKLMSKSEGGYIALNDPPQEMYGKVMALPDEVVFSCLRLCTPIPLGEITEMEEDIKSGELSRRDAKAFLARESVRMYYGAEKAERAEKEFVRVFKEKELPSHIPVIRVEPGKSWTIDSLLVRVKLASSKSEARRLVQQGGVKINGEVFKNLKTLLEPSGGDVLIQVGKRRYATIR